MTFFDQLAHAEQANASHLCIGLDPRPDRFPDHLRDHETAIFDFGTAIVDATRDQASCYKPQIAYFAAQNATDVLQSLIAHIHDTTDIPVLLDAKRGDIDSTCEHYAIEAFEVFKADAVTVNPYMGADSITPFTSYADKGVFVLCKTSNAAAGAIQNLRLDDGRHLYEHIAEMAHTQWNAAGNVGLVVGATMPEEAALIRQTAGPMPFLIPGIGAQGGALDRIIAAAAGGSLLINAARAINYAGSGPDFADHARAAAQALRTEINETARQRNTPVFTPFA